MSNWDDVMAPKVLYNAVAITNFNLKYFAYATVYKQGLFETAVICDQYHFAFCVEESSK